MQDLGNLIKKKREYLGLNIQYISNQLKVRDVFIAAIEEGDISAFASSAYYYGYLKQYLLLLNLQHYYPESQCTKNSKLSINIPPQEYLNPSIFFALCFLALSFILYDLLSDSMILPLNQNFSLEKHYSQSMKN